MITLPIPPAVEMVAYDPKRISGTKRVADRLYQINPASAASVNPFSVGRVARSVESEASQMRSNTLPDSGAEIRYTVSVTLFAVMALLFVVDWLVASPILVGLGGLLGSAGCFIAVSAKRKSIELGR